jgi:co-chaperonin GroES (HSP10)
MIVCPTNNLLVKISKKFEDQQGSIIIDTSWNPNWHVASKGTVVSLPKKLTQECKNIPQIIKEGDEIFFSYKVVGDTTFENNTSAFKMVTKSEGFATAWENQDGEQLIFEKGMLENQWVATVTNRRGDLLHGRSGTHGEVENWIAQNFKFASGELITHDNIVRFEGEDYWKVRYSQVFAIKQGKGFRAVGDYVMIEPLIEENKWRIIGIEQPESTKFVLRSDKGWVKAVGKPLVGSPKLGIKTGDIVHFHGDMKEKYKFEGNDYYIVRQQFIYAKEWL